MTTGRLLIVEDIRDTLAGTLSELQASGIVFDHVTNVKDAIEQLRKTKYDLVLLDWRLPRQPHDEVSDNAGLAILNFIKSTDASINHNIPIIILTAQFSSIDPESLKQHPNCRYVISKLRMDDITSRTREILEARSDTSITAN